MEIGASSRIQEVCKKAFIKWGFILKLLFCSKTIKLAVRCFAVGKE